MAASVSDSMAGTGFQRRGARRTDSKFARRTGETMGSGGNDPNTPLGLAPGQQVVMGPDGQQMVLHPNGQMTPLA